MIAKDKTFSKDAKFRCYALLGLITIENEKFLVVADKVDSVGKLYKDDSSFVYCIKSTMFLPIKYQLYPSSTTKSLIKGMTEIINCGMYFCYNYDLTNPFKFYMNEKGKDLYKKANELYIWNKSICKELTDLGVADKWLVPIIQGYVGIIDEEIKGKEIKVALISRRRNKKAGTRFNARGIDDEGNVANTVETEQILKYSGNTYSFIQVRGTVPVFWKQTGISADVEFSRTAEVAFPAYTKHFDELVKLYSHILVINLLAPTKKGEAKLIKAFEAMQLLMEG